MESADRFIQLVNRPAAEAHLDLMAALIGAAFEPSADPPSVVLGLDRLAEECAPNFESVMSTLFASGRLRGNLGDYGDPRNSYLHQVLQRGIGIPITLSVCAIEVGRRLDLDIKGVGLPGHFLVVCDGRYGDPFHSGKVLEYDEVEPAWRRSTGLRDPFDPRLLHPTSSRSILLRILNNLKATLVAMDDPVPLRVLARLRGAFPELASEQKEHARWVRHWN